MLLAAAKVPIVATAAPIPQAIQKIFNFSYPIQAIPKTAPTQSKTSPVASPKPGKPITKCRRGTASHREREGDLPFGAFVSCRIVTKADPAEGPSSRLIHRVTPEYPVSAKAKHIQGHVVMNVQVLNDGGVGNVE